MLAWLNELFESFGATIANNLPKSPFSGVIEYLDNLPALGFLNWFIPVGWIVNTMSAWLVAIAAYYALQIILRWVKVVD